MHHSEPHLKTDAENEQRLLAETLQEVTLVFASQTDPSAVLDEILHQAQRLVPFKTSSITLLEDDTLRVVRARGYGDVGSAAFISSLVQQLSDLPLDRQVIQSRKPLVVSDVHNEPNWVKLKETAWIRSILVVPIAWADNVLGLLRFDSPTPGTFSIKDAENLQPLANAAAIALENARLIEKVQRHAAQLEERVAERTAQLEQYSQRQAALADFELAINLPEELNDVLKNAAETVTKLLPTSGGTCLVLSGSELENVDFCAGESSQSIIQIFKDCGLPALIKQHNPMVVSDLHKVSWDFKSALLQVGVQAYVGVPLLAQDEVLGVMVALDTAPRHYTPEDIDFMITLANRASVAITKVRLYKQLAEAKDAAVAASRAKSEFLANITHELRTPLSSIIGFTELLIEQNFGPLNDKQKRYTENILTSSQNLLGLINDLLDLAKIEANRLVVDAMQFDVASAITDSLKKVEPMAADKQQTLRSDIKEALPLVTADLPIFRKVLHHLLTNAVKYTPVGGNISLSVSRLNGVDQPATPDVPPDSVEQVCISVTDTGIGLTKQDMERVFSVFEQLDASYSRQQQGTGLGLALTKRLVEIQGGRIWVTSQGPGQGSTFSFTLPIRPPSQREIK